MCLEMEDVKKKLEILNEFLEEGKKTKSIKKKAYLYAISKVIQEKCDSIQNSLKKQIVSENVNEFFDDIEMKISVSEGKTKTFLDVEKIKNILTAKQFLAVASVTETALKNSKIRNIEEIISDCKREDGKSDPTVTARKYSADDKKERGV